MTYEELEAIPKIDRSIAHKKDLIDMYQGYAEDITTHFNRINVRSSRQTDRVSDFSIKIADLITEAEEDIKKLVNLKYEATQLFKQLPGNEREIMELRYLNGYTWEHIADETNYSFRNVMRLKKISIKRLFNIESE